MNFDSDTNVVDVHIRRELRSKVDDPFEKKLIQTVRGKGYVVEERPWRWSLAGRADGVLRRFLRFNRVAGDRLPVFGDGANVDLEDDRVLADRVRLLQMILQTQPLDMAAIQQEVDEALAQQNTQLYIRLLDADGTPITQSPRMDRPPQAGISSQPTITPRCGASPRASSTRFRISVR